MANMTPKRPYGQWRLDQVMLMKSQLELVSR